MSRRSSMPVNHDPLSPRCERNLPGEAFRVSTICPICDDPRVWRGFLTDAEQGVIGEALGHLYLMAPNWRAEILAFIQTTGLRMCVDD